MNIEVEARNWKKEALKVPEHSYLSVYLVMHNENHSRVSSHFGDEVNRNKDTDFACICISDFRSKVSSTSPSVHLAFLSFVFCFSLLEAHRHKQCA